MEEGEEVLSPCLRAWVFFFEVMEEGEEVLSPCLRVTLRVLFLVFLFIMNR
jgi:hypothetical protein